jgi:hypothetical protein
MEEEHSLYVYTDNINININMAQKLTVEDHEAMGNIRHCALVTKWMRYTDDGILHLTKARYIAAHKNWNLGDILRAEENDMHRTLGTTAYTNKVEPQILAFDSEEDAQSYVRYKRGLIASTGPEFTALWPNGNELECCS